MPRPTDDTGKRAAFNRRLRLAFYQGAAKKAGSRGHMYREDLERVLRRYRGDL